MTARPTHEQAMEAVGRWLAATDDLADHLASIPERLKARDRARTETNLDAPMRHAPTSPHRHEENTSSTAN